jgi:hypothetical protein
MHATKNIRLLGNISIIIISLLYIILGCLRSATADETTYLKETMILSNSIYLREWFGNYAVGLHGFLFKIPVALLYLLTGPSVATATVFNTVLAGICLYVFFQILYKNFSLRGWALAGVLFLATSFRFYTSTLTYLREIPVLLTVLLFIDSVLNKRSRWLIGLIMLLMVDAKEYVFYIFSVSYALWSVVVGYLSVETAGIKAALKNTVATLVSGLGPPFVYLILMFYTSLVPINMFNASILGFIDKGFEWTKGNFSTQNATLNLMDSSAKTIAQLSYPAKNSRTILNVVIFITNELLSYLGKILYPRTFSFLSIPKIVFIPSIAMSLYYLIHWFRRRQLSLLILPITLFTYVFIFVIRASYARYLFPVSPLIFLFFIFFLKDGIKNVRLSISILLLSILAVAGGLYFEVVYVGEKIILNIAILSALLFLLWGYAHNNRYLIFIEAWTVFVIGLSTLSVAIFYSYKVGQIGQYIKWGSNMECDKISTLTGSNKTWINNIGCDELPLFFRQDLGSDPEWYWKLASWVPKKRMLVQFKEPNTYNFRWNGEKDLMDQIRKNSVRHIILTKSNLTDYKFEDEEKLPLLQSQKWLVQKNIYYLKNKTTYVFDVILN